MQFIFYIECAVAVETEARNRTECFRRDSSCRVSTQPSISERSPDVPTTATFPHTRPLIFLLRTGGLGA